MTAKENENIRRDDEVLRELLVGIWMTGIVGQIICLFFSAQALFISKGWWMGVIVASFMAIHMYKNLHAALSFGEGDAISSVRMSSIIRYLVALVVMVVIHLTNCASVVTYVFGIFTLKAGAYMQPVMHRVFVACGFSLPYPKGEKLEDIPEEVYQD